MSDEFVGLGPRRARTGTLATMCELVIDCPTLESVYRQTFQFSRLEGVYALNKISIFSRAKQGERTIKRPAPLFSPAFLSKAEVRVASPPFKTY
ncbi:hypothetical protein [Marinobacter subterrani]|uniref:hypothetical protein n=1 Tax=Marinobacter subterrani TaxID=1658765 RepID=UPI0023578CC7|nr:hypothetical protein [Marinobacter subterrani]